MAELLLQRLFKRGLRVSKDFIEVQTEQGLHKATDTKRTVKTVMYVPHNIDDEWKKKIQRATKQFIYPKPPHIEVKFDLRVDRFFTADRLPDDCSDLFDDPKKYIVIDGGQVLPQLEVGGVIIHHGLEGVPCFFKRKHFKLVGNEEEQRRYLEQVMSREPFYGKYILRQPEVMNGNRETDAGGSFFKDLEAEFDNC